MKVETKKLDNILSKVSKAASNQKTLPLTDLITLIAENNTLTLYTTNLIHTMYGFVNYTDDDAFRISVDVTMLTKLVHAITTEHITLTAKKGFLYITGNGQYRIAAMNDGGGMPVYIKDIRKDGDFITKIDLDTIRKISKSISISVAPPDFAVPCYKNIYFGEKILASDTSKLSVLDKFIFNIGYLISNTVVSLLNLFEEDIIVTLQDDMFSFNTSSFRLIAPFEEISKVEDYQADALLALVDISYSNKITLDKKSILELLNRFSILGQTNLILSFGNTLEFKSKDGSFSESLSIASKPFELTVNYLILKQYINTFDSETFDLLYEDEKPLMLRYNDITHILS